MVFEYVSGDDVVDFKVTENSKRKFVLHGGAVVLL